MNWSNKYNMAPLEIMLHAHLLQILARSPSLSSFLVVDLQSWCNVSFRLHTQIQLEDICYYGWYTVRRVGDRLSIPLIIINLMDIKVNNDLGRLWVISTSHWADPSAQASPRTCWTSCITPFTNNDEDSIIIKKKLIKKYNECYKK